MTVRGLVPSTCSWRLILLLLVIHLGETDSLTSTTFINSRFVCLIQDYDKVQGPYFHALLDQMLENECQFDQRKLALCTTQKYHDANKCQDEEHDDRLSQLKQDFDLNDGCQKLFVLDDYNPITLQEEMNNFDPTIFWLVDDNAFRIRYYMRTSGLDGIVQQKCGGSSSGSVASSLYVGENAGALCAGASLTGARKLQQDPKEAPEPQFFGLGLLGTERSVAIQKSSEEESQSNKESSSDDSSSNNNMISLDQDSVYIWSQPTNESATSFVFLPSQRGAIANLESPPNLPPLVLEEDDIGGGVQCTGEPAIDPSRVMEQVGDSEWINEAEDLRQ